MDTPRAALINAEDIVPQTLAVGVTCRQTVDRERLGCRNLVQRWLTLVPGAIYRGGFDDREEIFFVAAGTGSMALAGRSCRIEAGTGALIEPGQTCDVVNGGKGPMSVISVWSPPPGFPGTVPPARNRRTGASPVVYANRQPREAAGKDRRFQILVSPRTGSRYVTQFLGTIRQSKAPVHHHPYEEVIAILAGRGVLHLDEGDLPFAAGDCIYLPVGARHCLENPYPEEIQLLGVFCPAGSPAVNYES